MSFSKIISFAMSIACVFFVVPKKAQAYAYNTFVIDYRYEEVHPYDQPGRKPRATVRSRSSVSRRVHPYYQRTQTHGLHPYYRAHYYDTLSVQDNDVYGDPYATYCTEYSYYRAHNRLPPKQFRCVYP